MDKITEFKISIERLTKVWQSKMEFGEEVLVAEDLHWLVENFDKFFNSNNINDFININGRYTYSREEDGFDFSNNFQDLSNYPFDESKNKYIYIEPNLDEINKSYNDFINREIQHNIIDIFIKTCKRLFGFAIEKELKKSQIIIIWVLRKIFYKTMTFESPSLKSGILLKDFLNENILFCLNENELKILYPSKEFICFTYFIAVLEIYFDSNINANKANIVRLFLLKSWNILSVSQIYLLKFEFIKELSRKNINKNSYKDLDLYSMSRMLVDGDIDHPFIVSLRKLEDERKKIITKDDLDSFYEIYRSCSNLELPEGIDQETHEYFVKSERDMALQIFKFRELQKLILEILSHIIFYDGKEKFKEAVTALQRNDQFSNYLSFFPTSENQLIAWIFLLDNIKSEMLFEVDTPNFYRHLNDVLNFLLLKYFSLSFNIKEFEHSLISFEILNNSSVLNSLKDLVKGIVEVTEYSEFFTLNEKVKITDIWNEVVKCFDEKIQEAEILLKIPPEIFLKFRDSVLNKYKEESIIYKIGKFPGINSTEINNAFNFQTKVARNDFIFRKHFIPNWHVPLYGLTDNVANDLSEQENLQFEIELFHEYKVKVVKKVNRRNLAVELNKIYRPSFILFKNSFPQYWLNEKFGYIDNYSSQDDLFGQHSVYNYRTFDSNPELLIIPKDSIYISGLVDLKLQNFDLIENRIQWRILDLAFDDDARNKILGSPPEFLSGYQNIDMELMKYLWLRIVVSNNIFINPKDILRFKLDPYDE